MIDEDRAFELNEDRKTVRDATAWRCSTRDGELIAAAIERQTVVLERIAKAMEAADKVQERIASALEGRAAGDQPWGTLQSIAVALENISEHRRY